MLIPQFYSIIDKRRILTKISFQRIPPGPHFAIRFAWPGICQQSTSGLFMCVLIRSYGGRCITFCRCNSECSNPMYLRIAKATALIVAVLPGFLNGCILLFVISASNSDLYISSRTLYALALGGAAPTIFAKTDKRGVPYIALAAGGLFACLAYMNVGRSSEVVFKYL